MNAKEAQNITARNSSDMKRIYNAIARSAQNGNKSVVFGMDQINDSHIKLLRDDGYKCGFTHNQYGQLVEISW